MKNSAVQLPVIFWINTSSDVCCKELSVTGLNILIPYIVIHAETIAGDGGNVLHGRARLPRWSLPVPADCHEAAQDGEPHLLQQDVPRLLLRRFPLRQHWNILPLQVVDRQVIMKITLCLFYEILLQRSGWCKCSVKKLHLLCHNLVTLGWK